MRRFQRQWSLLLIVAVVSCVVAVPTHAQTRWPVTARSDIDADKTSTPAAANRKSPLGVNLGGITYWLPEVVFTDVMRQSSPWFSQKDGAGWDKGGPLDLTPDGWIKSLAPGHRAEKLMLTSFDGTKPTGRYVCPRTLSTASPSRSGRLRTGMTVETRFSVMSGMGVIARRVRVQGSGVRGPVRQRRINVGRRACTPGALAR